MRTIRTYGVAAPDRNPLDELVICSPIEASITHAFIASKGCAYAESEAAAGFGSRVRSPKSADYITATSGEQLDEVIEKYRPDEVLAKHNGAAA